MPLGEGMPNQVRHEGFKLGMRCLPLCHVLATGVGFFEGLYAIGIYSYIFRKVAPGGVEVIDQFILPGAMPVLELLLSLYGHIQSVMYFVIHQFVNIVLGGEAWVEVKLVFSDSALQVAGDAGV